MIGIWKETSYQGGAGEYLRKLADEDYQDTARFREFMESRLDDFFRMACGEYVGNYGYYGYDEAYVDAVAEAGGIDQEAFSEYVWEQEQSEAIESYGSEAVGEWKLTEEEKKKSISDFHNRIRADKNLLYQISYDGKELYSNMEHISWTYGKKKDLPSGYNFMLSFDGKKVEIIKDGIVLDVYGDGIYREESDWCLPGFQNYAVKEKWKKARILVLAAKEPMIYAGSNDYDEDGYWAENELYYMYKDYAKSRRQMQQHLAAAFIGLALAAYYAVRKKERHEAGKHLAKLTAKIWPEGKALLFLAVPLVICFGIWRSALENGTFAYVAEIIAEDVSSAYAAECVRSMFVGIAGKPVSLILVFWLFYLFACDLRYNKESYKKSFFYKFVAVCSSRDLNLPLSKKIMKKTRAISILTLFLLPLPLCLLAAALLGEACGAQAWIGGLALISLAVIAALLAAVYIYQKKNRRFAEDIERLSGRISTIRGGSYGSEEAAAFGDADIGRMAEELEEIRQGLANAVEERIRSERMKVELVANVSHDIKTPLTSIISYIQLLKQEEHLPAHIMDYIRILDEKSERLKNMVQDVFAVSKAASGQLSVEMEALDLGKLLLQTLADMEEEIRENPVAIKTEMPKEPVMVRADGGRMYRVFQNLIGNALKYSLDGSRIYVAVKKEGEFASASIKNISSRELNHGTDFTERFIRGDESRTDGGSGLGLSIAKSFTEACGGTFALETIADLFVVTVSFQVLQEKLEN